MLVNIAERNRDNPRYPSGLMRRMGYEDAQNGRFRQHGSPEYLQGYEEGLKQLRRAEQ